ncbi:hypothetical protein F4561_004251 [Lipingzhangella halophila]|uniref:Elongation factor SelB fourth winged-helix domain-containing protein n=1 Tax=Lipingzhangella halophila TaxID=1783352 RepID=A0A7W7RKY7_9ACTN|nr:SelB C-terminal domain-containing protein [Lipingzhangella halophila]MBB4933431.1 hypothetical protein [Lipingzhangella halophila]
MTADAIATTGPADHSAAACLPALAGTTESEEDAAPVAGCYPAGPGDLDELRHRLGSLTAGYALRNPGAPGVPVEAVRLWLGLRDRRLVESLVSAPLAVRHRHIVAAAAGPRTPGPLVEPLTLLTEALAPAPFRAPTPARLAKLGFTRAGLAAGVRTGLLVRIGSATVLPIEAVDEAVRVLAGWRQPFTTADARRALDTSRRVAGPFLAHLDRRGLTRWVGERHRTLAPGDVASAPPGQGRTVSP